MLEVRIWRKANTSTRGVERLWSRIKSWISGWKTTNFGNGSYNIRSGSLRIYGTIDLDRKGRNNLDIRYIYDDIDLGDISNKFILIIYEDFTSGTTNANKITYTLNMYSKVNVWQMEFKSGSNASWQWKLTAQGEGKNMLKLPRRKDGNITLLLFLSM